MINYIKCHLVTSLLCNAENIFNPELYNKLQLKLPILYYTSILRDQMCENKIAQSFNKILRKRKKNERYSCYLSIQLCLIYG